MPFISIQANYTFQGLRQSNCNFLSFSSPNQIINNVFLFFSIVSSSFLSWSSLENSLCSVFDIEAYIAQSWFLNPTNYLPLQFLNLNLLNNYLCFIALNLLRLELAMEKNTNMNHTSDDDNDKVVDI